MQVQKVVPSAKSMANRLDRLRVRHLKLLELVGESGSLTVAASALHISQPSATKMLQDLEGAFGHILVDRTTRGGSLSVAGMRVLERLRIATGSLDAISEALAADAEMPLVRIGMLPLAGVLLIPRLVTALSSCGELPRIQLVEGTVSSVLAMLREGHIDCVIGRAGVDSAHRNADEFEIMSLTDERFEVACGSMNPLARKRHVQLTELRDYPWIIPAPNTYTRQIFDTAFVSLGVAAPPAQIESSSFYVSLATVAESDLLTIAPKSTVEYHAALGKVRKLNLTQPFQPDFAVFITLKSTSQLHSVALIRQTLKEIAASCQIDATPGKAP